MSTQYFALETMLVRSMQPKLSLSFYLKEANKIQRIMVAAALYILISLVIYLVAQNQSQINMLRILLLVTVAILTQQAQEVRFTYEGKAYDIIHSILGKSGYEVPDCGHHVEHITTLHDSELGKNVFGYDLHVNQDDDRCIKQDRQRSEMAVDAGSPAWMHGSDGKTYSFSWKFKLDAGFKESG